MFRERFYSEPYLKELDTELVDYFEEDGNFFYVFKDTIFYPEGGGQECDIGYINNVRVEDVFKEGDFVWHKLGKKLVVGKVHMEIDWKRRYSLMKNHTAQHLLSAIFEREYGLKTLSSHIGDKYFSIELSTKNLPLKDVEKVEYIAFDYITKGLKVKKYFMDIGKAKKLPLRKESNLEGEVRVVEIDGVDYSLCKGLHVEKLSELGLITFFKRDRVRKNLRLYFKSGEFGFRYLLNLRRYIKKIVENGNISEEKVVEIFFKNIEDVKKLKKDISRFEKKFCESFVKYNLDRNIIFEKLEIVSEKGLRFLANQLLKEGKKGIISNGEKVFVFINIDDEKKFLNFLNKNELKMWGRNGVFEGILANDKGLELLKNFFN